MKFGLRTPSIKKMISSQTTGRTTRSAKKAIVPSYGTKGMGMAHPRKAMYNKVYRKTSTSIFSLFK